jgi:hypothetical protein
LLSKKLAICFSVLLLFAGALAACSTAKRATAPVVRTIDVIPAVDPEWYTLRNKNAISLISPIVDVGNAIDSRTKAQSFTVKMLDQKAHLGDQLTTAVVNALNEQGFKARVIPARELEGVNLREIDYEHFKSDADAVLHVYFTEVGVYSGYTTLDYHLKTDIFGYLFSPKDGSYIHQETIYYGVDGREGKSWSVPADPKYTYTSFEALIERAQELALGFGAGTHAAAKRMAENFRKALP